MQSRSSSRKRKQEREKSVNEGTDTNLQEMEEDIDGLNDNEGNLKDQENFRRENNSTATTTVTGIQLSRAQTKMYDGKI